MFIIEFRLQPIFDRFGIVAFEALLDQPDCLSLFARADPEFELECFSAAVRQTSGIPYPVFVNISAKALVECRHRLKLAPNTVIEITEHHPADIRALKKAVKNLTISLDDFGSGYSCRLIELNPNYVKISSDIIKNCHLHEVKKSLIREFASWRSYGIDIIAEGIEAPKEYETCLQAGIVYFQGYWLARPSKKWHFINLRKEGVAVAALD